MKMWYSIRIEDSYGNIVENHDDIIEELRNDNMDVFLATDFTGTSTDKVDWLYMEQEMQMFSAKYPECVFVVTESGKTEVEYRFKDRMTL